VTGIGASELDGLAEARPAMPMGPQIAKKTAGTRPSPTQIGLRAYPVQPRFPVVSRDENTSCGLNEDVR
jgi:hypothetical protein